MNQTIENARRDGFLEDSVLRTGKELRQTFPYLQFAINDTCLHESIKSGHINPRKLVMAQISLASQQGCDVIRDTVIGLVRETNGHYRIITSDKRIIISKKVLLATNVFTVVDELLGNLIPSCTLMPQTVSLIEISQQDAERLRYIYHNYPHQFHFNSKFKIIIAAEMQA